MFTTKFVKYHQKLTLIETSGVKRQDEYHEIYYDDPDGGYPLIKNGYWLFIRFPDGYFLQGNVCLYDTNTNRILYGNDIIPIIQKLVPRLMTSNLLYKSKRSRDESVIDLLRSLSLSIYFPKFRVLEAVKMYQIGQNGDVLNFSSVNDNGRNLAVISSYNTEDYTSEVLIPGDLSILLNAVNKPVYNIGFGDHVCPNVIISDQEASDLDMYILKLMRPQVRLETQDLIL